MGLEASDLAGAYGAPYAHMRARFLVTQNGISSSAP